jgi:hypothetical protein
MNNAAKTQIIVAVIGVIGAICVALIANLSGIFSTKSTEHGIQYSTTCKFTSGPRIGAAQYYPPGGIGVVPTIVGGPCTDGARSFGYAIRDGIQ